MKKGIQDKDVQIEKPLELSIVTVNMGILHLVLPTGDDQDLWLLQ
jgi:hypothetical protein